MRKARQVAHCGVIAMERNALQKVHRKGFGIGPAHHQAFLLVETTGVVNRQDVPQVVVRDHNVCGAEGFSTVRVIRVVRQIGQIYAITAVWPAAAAGMGSGGHAFCSNL